MNRWACFISSGLQRGALLEGRFLQGEIIEWIDSLSSQREYTAVPEMVYAVPYLLILRSLQTALIGITQTGY